MKKLRDLHKKISQKSVLLSLWTVIVLCNVVFLTRSYFGASKGMTYMKEESLESTDIDSKDDTIFIAAAVTFATQVIFALLRTPKLVDYFIYDSSKCDFIAPDGSEKEYLITNKTAFARVEDYLFLYNHGSVPKLIPLKPSKLRLLDEVMKTSALRAKTTPNRTLTNREYKWLLEFTNTIPEVEAIHDKSSWHKYYGIGVGKYFTLVSYANLPFACLSAFLGTIKSLDNIIHSSADDILTSFCIFAYGIQNDSFNVPKGIENSQVLAKSIREGTFNPKKSHVAITVALTSLSILATMGFYVLGVEGLPSVPLLNYFFQTPESILAARIIAGWVGLFYPIIVQLPATYEWVSKSKPLVFPNVKSKLLQTLSCGLLENPYKFKHFNAWLWGLIDAVGGGLANAYGIANFIANRLGMNAYAPGFKALNYGVITSSIIIVLQFNAVGPSKESIPKIFVLNLKDPNVQHQIISSERFIPPEIDFSDAETLLRRYLIENSLPRFALKYPTSAVPHRVVIDLTHPKTVLQLREPHEFTEARLLKASQDSWTAPKNIRLLEAEEKVQEHQVDFNEFEEVKSNCNETHFTIVDDWFHTEENDDEFLAKREITWKRTPDFSVNTDECSPENKGVAHQNMQWKQPPVSSDVLFQGLTIHTQPVMQNGSNVHDAKPMQNGNHPESYKNRILKYFSGSQSKLSNHANGLIRSLGKSGRSLPNDHAVGEESELTTPINSYRTPSTSYV